MAYAVSSYEDVLDAVRLGTDGGEVTARFSSPTVALALPPAQARSLAIQLWRLARVAEVEWPKESAGRLSTVDDDGRLAGG
jgi:hypothetical protein